MKNIKCTNCGFEGKPYRTSPLLLVLLGLLMILLFFPLTFVFLYFAFRKSRCPKCGWKHCLNV